MKKQSFILILISVVLILLVGFIYFNKLKNNNTNTNEEPNNQKAEIITSDVDTSDWEIYRNEELGFEVKYPEDWHYREDGYQFSPFPLGPNNDGGIFVSVISDNLSIDDLDYRESVLKAKESGFVSKYATKHLISLHDKELWQFLEGGNNRATWFMKNNNLWSVFFVSGGEIPLDIYNAFLLNFEFID